ncbi:hypothetical protein IL306_003165 [Fusarium sp. DS 682]|nr:hypothetical protein IL306_003165 [Fusarium sp. DS 682]
MSNKGLPALRPPGSGKGKPAPAVYSPVSAGGNRNHICCQDLSSKGECAVHRDREELKKLDDKVDAMLRLLEDLKQDLMASTTLTV